MVRGSKTIAGGRVKLKKKIDRAIHDDYPTPPFAVHELLKRENFEGSVLEPCSGKGHIVNALLKDGIEAEAFDIRDEEGIVGARGVDFLETDCNHDNIITNPPYALAQEFIEKGLSTINKKMALLLRLSYLESQGRYPLFKSTPIKKVYIFSKRLPFWDGDKWNESGGQFTHAWFIWEKGHEGLPTFDWILH